MKALTENTLIPLGIAILAIGGGSMWITSLYAEVQSTSTAVKEARTRQEETSKTLNEINERLSRIEWKLEKGK